MGKKIFIIFIFIASNQDSLSLFILELQKTGRIRGEGDISKVTLENTREIEEGESNILAVYTREEDKKELYEHLCRIPFEGDTEEEFLNAAYEEELLQKQIDEVKGEAYYIEVENKQGETFFWKYQIAGFSQMISDADYLLVNQGEFVVGVLEEDNMFWRKHFSVNSYFLFPEGDYYRIGW